MQRSLDFEVMHELVEQGLLVEGGVEAMPGFHCESWI